MKRVSITHWKCEPQEILFFAKKLKVSFRPKDVIVAPNGYVFFCDEWPWYWKLFWKIYYIT